MSRPAPTSPACAPELASLALAFRDAAERHDYAARHPDFLPWLQDVVRHRVRATDDGVAELCKLVANFVADEDPNRALICSHTAFLALVRSRIDNPTDDLLTLKPLLASVLNLVLSESYLDPHTALLPSWLALVDLANGLHIPAQPVEHDRQERATLCAWAWQSIHRILDGTTSQDPPSDIPLLDDHTATHRLLRPFTYFTPPAETPTPTPTPTQRGSGTMREDLVILDACADVVGLLVDHPAGRRAFVRELQTDECALVRFIEHGEVVDGWTTEDDSDSDSEDDADADGAASATTTDHNARPGEKALGRVKARLMASLADLCAEPGMRLFPTPNEETSSSSSSLGSTFVRWIGKGRDDLVTCGVLCVGNYITDDDRAREITSHPTLTTLLGGLLDGTTPSTSPQRTHALLGALRNLCLAPSAAALRAHLAPRVLACVRRAELLLPRGDLVASVQGGAVALIRLLCRGDETISRDALTDEALSTQITHLWQRTDEQSLRIEIARLLVVLARLPEACAPLATDERAVRAVAGLLAVGTQQEVLLAEGVMALALLAKAEAGARAVYDVLASADDKSLQSLEAFAASPAAPPAVLSNMCILLLHLAQARHAHDDEDETAARVRRTLDAVAARDAVDESLAGAVAAARTAWR